MTRTLLIIVIIGCLAILVAFGVNRFLWQEEIADQNQSPTSDSAPESPSPATPGAVQPQAVTEADKPQNVIPDNQPILPAFDIIRISPDGKAVVAGRAAPQSMVTIIDNGQESSSVRADHRGEWVYVPDVSFTPGNHRLSLHSVIDGHPPVTSEDVMVLIVPEPNKDIAGQKTDQPSQALVLKFPKKGGPTTVLQKPSGDAESKELTVDTVDYNQSGHLTISGRAKIHSQVFSYLDNRFIGQAVADETGIWTVNVNDLPAPGLYNLRVDLVNTEGAVIARVSMPFSRADPGKEQPGDSFIVVQPGNSLWRLATRTYGSGFQYTTIYEANQDQIKDSNLIYPGQIFTVPTNN